MKRYEQRLAQKYGPPKKRLAVKDIEAVMVSVAAGEYVKHTDHLAAVSSARADALRWALASIETESDTWRKAAECKITGYQTRSDAVSSACARLRAIIEKELKKCPK